MNLKNYYWWFDSIIPSRVCDEIVKYGVSQNSQLGITGDFKDSKEYKKFKYLEIIITSFFASFRSSYLNFF